MRCFWQRLAFTLACVLMSTAQAQNSGSDEYKLKAAFLYNFTQYVEWPATAFSSASSPFVLCVAGHNLFGEHLKALESRNYKGRPISLVYPRNVSEARACHLLYSDEVRPSPLGRDAWKALADAPILTVTSAADTGDSGMAIGFVAQSGRLRWALNLASTRQAQLKVSSKLVEIALAVTGESR
jgi:hypothetical protein